MRENSVGQGGPVGGMGPDLAPNKIGDGGGGSYLSRRDFLKAAGASLLAGACGVRPTQVGDTPKPPGVTLQAPEATSTARTPTPLEIPQAFTGEIIDTKYLIDQWRPVLDSLSSVQEGNPILEPEPTPVAIAESQSPSAPKVNLYEFTRLIFALPTPDNLDSQTPPNEILPLELTDINVLRVATAAGIRRGTSGGVTYMAPVSLETGEILPLGKLAFYREQAFFPQTEFTISNNVYPEGLVLHNGAGITIEGITKEGKYLIAFEENFRRNSDRDTIPLRVRFALIDKSVLENLIEKKYLQHLYYTDQPDKFEFDDPVDPNTKRSLSLNLVDDDVLKGLGIAVAWAEKVPSHINEEGEVDEWIYHPQPEVRAPDPEKDELPEGIDPTNFIYVQEFDYEKIGATDAVRYLARARNEDGSAGDIKLVAEYDSSTREWKWNPVTPEIRVTPDFRLVNENGEVLKGSVITPFTIVTDKRPRSSNVRADVDALIQNGGNTAIVTLNAAGFDSPTYLRELLSLLKYGRTKGINMILSLHSNGEVLDSKNNWYVAQQLTRVDGNLKNYWVKLLTNSLYGPDIVTLTSGYILLQEAGEFFSWKNGLPYYLETTDAIRAIVEGTTGVKDIPCSFAGGYWSREFGDLLYMDSAPRPNLLLNASPYFKVGRDPSGEKIFDLADKLRAKDWTPIIGELNYRYATAPTGDTYDDVVRRVGLAQAAGLAYFIWVWEPEDRSELLPLLNSEA